MDSLLAQLERNPRRLLAGIALVGAAATAIALVGFGRASPTATVACDPPVVAPGSVWGPLQDGVIRAGSTDAADWLGAAFAHWRDVRASVCAQASPTRAGQLTCLDKVLLRIDAVRRARLLAPQMGLSGVVSQLYEPEACLRDDPPRMPDHYSDNAVLGLAMRGGATAPPAVIARAHTSSSTTRVRVRTSTSSIRGRTPSRIRRVRRSSAATIRPMRLRRST